VRRPGQASLLAAIAMTTAATAAGDRGTTALPFLLAARITEVPPFDADRIVDRRITLSVILDRAPVCGAGRAASSFAFLIDADRSTATGAVRDDTGELGVDAEVSIWCDVTAGRFASGLGDVEVRASPDGDHEYLLSVTTRAGRLPSLEFDWIATARHDGRLSRVPAAGGAASWRVLERWTGVPRE